MSVCILTINDTEKTKVRFNTENSTICYKFNTYKKDYSLMRGGRGGKSIVLTGKGSFRTFFDNCRN